MLRCRRVLILLTTAVALVVSSASAASAHRNDESYLYMDVGDSTLSGRVELPYPDIRTVFGLRLSGSVAEIRAEVDANLELLQQYAKEKSAIGAEGEFLGAGF